MNKIQSLLLNMYEDINTVASKENIKLIGAFGTMLGAIRHKGFIPWDDDMDFFVWKSDFDKLIKSLQDNLPSHYKVINRQINSRFPIFHTRVVDTRYPVVRGYQQHKSLPNGLFIDIFTLEYGRTNPPMLKSKARLKRFVFLRNVISTKKLNKTEPIMKKNGKAKRQFWANVYRYLISWIPNWFLTWCLNTSHSWKVSDVKTDYIYPNDFYKFYKAKDFEELTQVEYENTKIYVPINYESVLTDEYGDWKNPPKNVKTHNLHIEEDFNHNK